jgi:hypothetical protein
LCGKDFQNTYSLKNLILGVHEGKKPYKKYTWNPEWGRKSQLKRKLKKLQAEQGISIE